MKATTTVSTTFASTHDDHQVNLLVNISADAPAARPPINVALVLDRSGSMDGEPLVRAREAALRFASFLTAADRLSIVAFHDDADLLFGPAQGNDPGAARAIRQITAAGFTNLSGGWLEAHRQVSRELLKGTNRIVLLTDGQANRGTIGVEELRLLAAGGLDGRVSTSCIGFGPHFNEDLLKSMADTGGGRFSYVQSADQMVGSFESEIEGLVSLAAQNLTLEISLSHPNVAGVSIVPDLPTVRTPDGGWRVRLGDLYAVQPRSVGAIFHVVGIRDLGDAELGKVAIHADIISDSGIEHRTVTLPVMATLDRQAHVKAEVESAFVLFAAARARQEAVRLADQGNFQAASESLRVVAETIPEDTPDQMLRATRADLLHEWDRLRHNLYLAEDRKYNVAAASYAREGRWVEEERLRRGRGR